MALKALQLITTIDGVKREIELFGDEDITLEMSFAEIQDITKKNSTYTQSFNVPGSKNNNDIFNHFYNPAATTITYDVRRSFKAFFNYNGNIILDGYVRLNSATTERTLKIYNITFYTEVGDLSAEIGDKFLYDLDLSDLIIPYNDEEIRKSQYNWDTLDFIPETDPIKDEKVYFPLLFSGYDYISGDTIDTNASPLLSFDGSTGSFTNSLSPLPFNYYRPAISVRELYTKIVNQAGYNIDSSFLDTSYFKRFYLPLTFTTDGLPLNQSYAPQLETEQFSSGGIPYKTPVRFTDTQSGGTASYLRASFRDVIVDNFNATTNPQVLYLETPGTYTIRFSATAGKKLGTDPSLLYSMFIWVHKLYNYPLFNNIGTTIYYDDVINAGPSGFTNFNFTLELQGGNAYTFDYTPGGGTGDTNTALIAFSTELISGPRQVSGNTIDFRLELPEKEYKQIDFIQSVNRTFNMVVVPKVDEEKTLIVEPMIDFIGKGNVLDWTQKVDDDKPIMITPITTFIDGTLFYNTKGDSDVGNTTFKEATNRPYGSQYILLNQDYKDKQTIFETLFCSSVDGGLDNLGEHLTIPQAALVKTQDIQGVSTQLFNAYRTLPRMVFKGTYTPIENWGYVPYYTLGGFYGKSSNSGYTYNHRFSTYPQAFTGFSHYTNYNSSDSFDTQETMFVDYPNLYDIYYKDYILDLTDEGNRMISASVYLTPEEIKNIQFNEKILYKNQYYRLNKLSNYSLLQPDLADVELVKLTRDYTPHPKVCVKITDCDTGDVYYSNTDRNYGFLAYVNRYVKFVYNIDVFCGYVELIDCSEAGNFTNILRVDTEYTYDIDNLGRLPLYDNCGCTTYTGISITQEVIPSPTPTPTPSNTPTPTNPPPSPTRTPTTTPTPSVSPAPQFTFNYVFENCDLEVENPYIILGAYSALTGTTIVGFDGGCYELIASSSQVATATWYSTFTGCSECNMATPTPTPSITPTITPTSSPIPFCVCKEYYIENNNPEPAGFSYVDCNGNTQFSFIPDFDNITICACEGSIVSEVALLINDNGSCTITPTPTPSAGECICRTYIITNNGESAALISYTDCYGNPQSFFMPALSSMELCGCLGSFSSESLVEFFNADFCVPITPTPTSSPLNITPTPTPSVSPTLTRTPTNTPTITPTNTNTPTMTSTPLGCSTYDVYNPNSYNYTTDYIDCSGNTISYTFTAFTTTTICCQYNGIIDPFYVLSITYVGTCPLPSPTPTQTPTNTATPTPTPAVCRTYLFSGESISADVYYYDCYGRFRSQVLNYSPNFPVSISICALNYPAPYVNIGVASITDTGTCITQPCSQYELIPLNTFGIGGRWTYYDCSGVFIDTGFIPFPTTQYVCAQNGTITLISGDGNNRFVGTCPTPTPTSTPTNTPTITPTITPTATDTRACRTYTIANTGFSCTTFNWTNCDGTAGTQTLCSYASSNICAKQGSVSFDINGTITDIGTCP